MRIKKLKEKIKILNDFTNKSHKNRTDTERKLLKVSKITEELWEFYNEFLISLNFTREWKTWDRKTLEKELADVILASLVVAEDLEIDIISVMEEKMKVVFDRYNLD